MYMEQTADNRMWSLMVRYISNELNLRETDELLSWLGNVPARTELLKELRETWDKSRDFQLPRFGDPQIAWNNLRNSIERREPPARHLLYRKYKIITIAAVSLIVVICVLFLGLRYGRHSYSIDTAGNENVEIILPDGSFTWLSENASLKYKRSFFDVQQREILLRGDAYFEIKGYARRDFNIHAGKAVINTKGARFYVEHGPANELKVLVKSGTVVLGLDGKDRQQQLLNALDEGTLYQDGSIGKMHLDNFPDEKLKKRQ